MPKPCYIICSQHTIESKETGLLTLVDVIEKLQLGPLPEPSATRPVFVPWTPFRVTAVWMLTADDNADAEYETDWQVVLPSGETIEMNASPHKATFTRAKPLFRSMAAFLTPLPLDEGGILRLISRLRKRGDADWKTQECELVVEDTRTQAERSRAHTPEAATQPSS